MATISKTYVANDVRLAFYNEFHHLAIYDVNSKNIHSSWILKLVGATTQQYLHVSVANQNLIISDDRTTPDLSNHTRHPFNFNDPKNCDCWFDGLNIIVGTGDIRDIVTGGPGGLISIFDLDASKDVIITCDGPRKLTIYSKVVVAPKPIANSNAVNL